MSRLSSLFFSVAGLILALSGSHVTAESAGEPGRDGGGPNPLKNVYFGEQHLHTTNSPDAFVVGVRQSWEEAYQWALGKEVKLSTSGETDQKIARLTILWRSPTMRNISG